MDKIIALFPDLTINEAFTINDTTLEKLNTEKGSCTIITCEPKNYEEEKASLRKLKVLRCHLTLAMYLASEEPLEICNVVMLKEEEEAFKYISSNEKKINISILERYIPNNLEKTGPTVCWFVYYLEHKQDVNDRSKVFGLYNALGSLLSDFSDITSIAKNKDEKIVLEKMIDRVRDFHKADDEDESYIYMTNPLTNAEIEYIERLYINHLKVLYPVFR
ncbi:MAG: hypothetical protein RIN55_05175 [Tissierellaceae bacterium]|nr:hypothetical protein [Tissierellaceae bacterium]